MSVMKTPGVYIVEKNAFPSSVVEVATAVPAFIGYTQRALDGNSSLVNKPKRITSLAEYHQFFGGAADTNFAFADAETAQDTDFSYIDKSTNEVKNMSVARMGTAYTFYYQMRMFFANGGGVCYIVSVGNYKDDLNEDSITAGIDTLLKEQEPTMVVVPEAVNFEELGTCTNIQNHSLQHSVKMRNRVAILDVFNGHEDLSKGCVDNFRESVSSDRLDFASAYYPWLNTTVVGDKDIDFRDFADRDPATGEYVDAEDPLKNLKAMLASAAGDEQVAAMIMDIDKPADAVEAADGKPAKPALVQMYTPANADGSFSSEQEARVSQVNKTLTLMSPLFKEVVKAARNKLNLLPPATAMAGVFSQVDNTRGVWKAPANVSLAMVTEPCVALTNDEQEGLNVTPQGKSVNAIRSFVGEGTMVWGARTLDGNSLDWRYISVRRTMIMLEESIRLGTKSYVFEANDAQTWVTVKSTIQNFLTGIWKRGGLAGASPADAFSVHVGLGDTMTPEDILEGIMRVSVFVAITRPAEFIEITFTQQMQKS